MSKTPLPAINLKTGKPKIPSRGGVRPGAGRPKGSASSITLQGILDKVRASGQDFEDAFVEDWIYSKGDPELRFKYNQLILNKMAPTLLSAEITEDDTVNGRQLAFLKAFEAISGVPILPNPTVIEDGEVISGDDE